MSVTTNPGARAFTCTPERAHSRARARVRPTRPVFRRHVRGLVAVPGEAEDGGHVDDLPPALGHEVAPRLPAEEEAGAQVQGEDPIPDLGVGVDGRRVVAARGVVHEDVQASEALEGLRDDRGGRVLLGEVGHQELPPPTHACDLLHGLLQPLLPPGPRT
jgi:hypothetical protein